MITREETLKVMKQKRRKKDDIAGYGKYRETPIEKQRQVNMTKNVGKGRLQSKSFDSWRARKK